MDDSPSRIYTAPSSAMGTPAAKGYRHAVDALTAAEEGHIDDDVTPPRTRPTTASDLTPSSAKRILKQMMFGLDVSRDIEQDDGAVGSSDPGSSNTSSSSSQREAVHSNNNNNREDGNIVVASLKVSDINAVQLSTGHRTHRAMVVPSPAAKEEQRPYYGCSHQHQQHHSKPPVDERYNVYFQEELTSPFKRPYSTSRSRTGDSFSHESDVTVEKIAASIMKDADDDVIGLDDYSRKKIRGDLDSSNIGSVDYAASKLSRRIAGPGEEAYKPGMQHGAGYGSIEFDAKHNHNSSGINFNNSSVLPVKPTSAALLHSPQLIRGGSRNRNWKNLIVKTQSANNATPASPSRGADTGSSPPGKPRVSHYISDAASPLKAYDSTAHVDVESVPSVSDRQQRKLVREQKRAQRLLKHQSGVGGQSENEDSRGEADDPSSTSQSPTSMHRRAGGPYIQPDPSQNRHHQASGASRRRNDTQQPSPTTTPDTTPNTSVNNNVGTAATGSQTPRSSTSHANHPRIYFSPNNESRVAPPPPQQDDDVAPESIVYGSPASTRFGTSQLLHDTSTAQDMSHESSSSHSYAPPTATAASYSKMTKSRSERDIANDSTSQRRERHMSPRSFQASEVAAHALQRFASRGASQVVLEHNQSSSFHPLTASPTRYSYLSGAPPPPRRTTTEPTTHQPTVASSYERRAAQHPTNSSAYSHSFSNHIYHSPTRRRVGGEDGDESNPARHSFIARPLTERERRGSTATAVLDINHNDDDEFDHDGITQLQSNIKHAAVNRPQNTTHTTNNVRNENKRIMESLFYRSIGRRCKQHRQLVHPLQNKTPVKSSYVDPQLIKVPEVTFSHHQRPDGLNYESEVSSIDRTYDPTFASIIDRQNQRTHLGLDREMTNLSNTSQYDGHQHQRTSLHESRRSASATPYNNQPNHVVGGQYIGAADVIAGFRPAVGSTSVTLGVSDTASRQRRLKLLRETTSLITICARDKPHIETVRIARKFNAAESAQEQIEHVKRACRTLRPARTVPSPLTENISPHMMSPPRDRLAALMEGNRKLLEDAEAAESQQRRTELQSTLKEPPTSPKVQQEQDAVGLDDPYANNLTPPTASDISVNVVASTSDE